MTKIIDISIVPSYNVLYALVTKGALVKTQAEKIREFLLKTIPNRPNDVVTLTCNKYAITKTTVHRHIETLIKEKKIIKSGSTRNISYMLSDSFNRKFQYKNLPQLEEDIIFKNDFNAAFIQLPKNIYQLLVYAFTEIFNNAIDHSRGTKIIAESFSNGKDIILSISDNGIGIFKNLHQYFQLDDIRESILQLNKGKMTTDPSHHSGEGLFFTARAFEQFEIFANGLHYFRDNVINDWTIKTISMPIGSKVIMKITLTSSRLLTDTFKSFQEEDDYVFDRTEIIVELSRLEDENLISRSQAKRILRNLEKFKKVTLDFKGVTQVGQGFVDEIFRVYANKHPEIRFDYINANEDVNFMIKRGIP